jgi:hypothetical protein|tara:strand:+ start:627 stop:1004 length:378 start_codon:yes stop_codon:yes gene_type:complete
MSYQLRKVERYTNYEATPAIDLDPVDFKDLATHPYDGPIDGPDGEKEFIKYIQEVYYNHWYDVCDELESKDRMSSSDALASLFEGEMEVYSSTTEKEEDAWMEIGEVDESYSRYGGFNASISTFE